MISWALSGLSVRQEPSLELLLTVQTELVRTSQPTFSCAGLRLEIEGVKLICKHSDTSFFTRHHTQHRRSEVPNHRAEMGPSTGLQVDDVLRAISLKRVLRLVAPFYKGLRKISVRRSQMLRGGQLNVWFHDFCTSGTLGLTRWNRGLKPCHSPGRRCARAYRYRCLGCMMEAWWCHSQGCIVLGLSSSTAK